ncbi:hypothetical protein K491DRAFT_419981 [Lophiostoma macrostomum CBS 122681]|uniref:Uncharacterized protein n=1 Tax=Lophiostoma macrostomum CBS 122681 TaxID=1314788 RepID=A0A6A6TNI1_9PLEO|nr:hypothetical protein K491DRAFT_419981 [Lophiostoma macrostomum CBS 122681]
MPNKNTNLASVYTAYNVSKVLLYGLGSRYADSRAELGPGLCRDHSIPFTPQMTFANAIGRFYLHDTFFCGLLAKRLC